MDECQHCRFFVQYDAPPGNPFGRCHRRSPLVTGGLHCEVSTVWPEVKQDDGCGEWESAK